MGSEFDSLVLSKSYINNAATPKVDYNPITHHNNNITSAMKFSKKRVTSWTSAARAANKAASYSLTDEDTPADDHPDFPPVFRKSGNDLPLVEVPKDQPNGGYQQGESRFCTMYNRRHVVAIMARRRESKRRECCKVSI